MNNRIVPNLEEIEDVEILEAESRIQLYRRFKIEKHVARKLFLFDCSVMPQRRIISSANKHFTLNYTSAERYALETMIVIINNSFNKSIFMASRISTGTPVTSKTLDI